MGGISKDDIGSSHGSLHHKAADLAVNATIELLEDIRLAVGDKNFLRYGTSFNNSMILLIIVSIYRACSQDILMI